jgi:hypothetical protein
LTDQSIEVVLKIGELEKGNKQWTRAGIVFIFNEIVALILAMTFWGLM